jgi:YTH domain-containing family protein
MNVVYNEDPSLMFHSGYGYDQYAPYSPISTPVPAAVSGDGQLYFPQQFSFSTSYYQQSVPPGMQFLSSPTPIS